MKSMQLFITSLRNELLSILLLLVIWSVAALFYPAFIIPSPLTVFSEFGSFFTASFLQQLGLTMMRVLIGFFLSYILGTGLGLLAVSKKLENSMTAMMMALQVLPGTILGVIFVLMFGIGSVTPIVLILFLVLPTIVVNTVSGLSKRNTALEEYLATLKSSKSIFLRYSYLPALVPVFQSNFNLGFSLALKIVVLGEFIGSQDGLGYLLNHARLIFNMKEVFFYLIIILSITLLVQAIQSLFFSLTCKRYLFAE